MASFVALRDTAALLLADSACAAQARAAARRIANEPGALDLVEHWTDALHKADEAKRELKERQQSLRALASLQGAQDILDDRDQARARLLAALSEAFVLHERRHAEAQHGTKHSEAAALEDAVREALAWSDVLLPRSAGDAEGVACTAAEGAFREAALATGPAPGATHRLAHRLAAKVAADVVGQALAPRGGQAAAPPLRRPRAALQPRAVVGHRHSFTNTCGRCGPVLVPETVAGAVQRCCAHSCFYVGHMHIARAAVA